MKYWYARLWVEIGRLFIEEGIDLAGQGRLEIEFNVGGGRGFTWFCHIVLAMVALPTLYIMAIIAGVL